MLVGVLLTASAFADAHAADERITQVTLHLADSLRSGDIDPPTYTLLFDLRTKAAKAVTRWLHGGPAFEPAAREAMDRLEDAL